VKSKIQKPDTTHVRIKEMPVSQDKSHYLFALTGALLAWLIWVSASAAAPLIVNGHELSSAQARWVAYIRDTILAQLLGDRPSRITVAARASWWGFKEGTFSLSNPHLHSICGSTNQVLGPLETCSPSLAWQVGPAAVQVPNFTEQQVLNVLSTLWPGRAISGVLAENAGLAGFDPSQGTGAAIVMSTGVLRKSWLMRHPAIGLTLVERNVTAECIDDSKPWCYGTGWQETRDYAPNRQAALQSISDLTTIFGVSSTGTISLSFPLGGSNPYTAPISSVVDHSSIPSGRFYSGSADNAVVAYTGELGKDICGPSRPCGFFNPSNNDFVVNGNYVGVNADGVNKRKILNYEGHPGYDYPCTAGEPVLAAASGTLIVPTSDPINGSPTTFNTFKIVHGGGWETWYLHTRNNLPSGTGVNGGRAVAQCWNTGPPGTAVHLHFEVRRNGKVVDPYGWEWNTADPISMNSQALVQLDPLWGILQPKVNSVSLTPISGDFTATITGQNFASGAVVTLWDRYCQFFVQSIKPTSTTATQIVANLLISPRRPEDFVLKVENPPGPRSKGVALFSSVPLALIGQPAPGGGTFSSFASFYAMNNRGDVIFNAVVDTSGAGTFKFSCSQFSKVTVPGIGNAGAARTNNRGDMAIGFMPVIGFTQAIYFLKSGTVTPIKIAEQGQTTPIGATKVYDDLRGPLVISDNGDVTFSAGVIDTVTHTGFCCYLFLYSNTDGSIIKVVGDGDATPVGGTFNVPVPLASHITSDGDVVFNSPVNGGPSGIFRFSRALGISKVVVSGDPAPQPVGGSIGNRIQMSYHSVSGRRLVFQATILGSTARQAIFAKDDVTLPGMRVIAYQGQPTGTEVGGTFDSLDHEPFSPVGDTPHIRADGAVLFISFYSHVGGLPTGRGIFLWTGKEFKKVVVNGDRLPSGQTLNGVGSYIMNDIGQVVYFVASIN